MLSACWTTPAALAASIGDDGALLTIPLQRLMILQDWAAPEAPSIDQIAADLDAGLKIFPEAEVYARPLFDSYMDRNRIAALLDNNLLVERIIVGGDRFTICRLAEFAIDTGRAHIVQRTFDALLPFRDQCATMGLMGSAWQGPVAEILGLAARSLGDPARARALLEEALVICERMQAGPAEARIQQHLSDLAREGGDAAEAQVRRDKARSLLERFDMKPERGANHPR